AKKLVNESFRSHCPTKYPVFAISISINATTIDVNLTPDKRTILIRHETQLLAALKEALANVLEPQESMFSVSRVQTQLIAEPAPRDNPDRRNVVSVKTSVPGVVMCYVEDPKSKVAGGSINNKRPSGHDADFNPPPSAASRQRLVEHMGGVISRPQPTSVSRPVDPKPTSKKLPSIVIGTCRNRMQNDEHDWQGIGARLREKQERRTRVLEESQQGQVLPDEYAAIDTAVAKSGISETNPEDASSALSQLIHKTDFARMSVIGQFNRGFIIARLDQDLYIIDQHASDEKYNFEQLQQRAVISSQPLIRPAQLELSIVDEGVAIEHKETLMRNGFHVRVDDTEAPGRKVSLLSQPFIDQTLFNQQDLLELVGKLCINPESMPRCERARKMFASRACRRSTMIGDSLSLTQMKAIVRHLSDLDHPWNCPHGRPTMRHLHRLKD
ncbi:hypothetical protein GGF37_006205, partial [Kickxella alabastrina]